MNLLIDCLTVGWKWKVENKSSLSGREDGGDGLPHSWPHSMGSSIPLSLFKSELEPRNSGHGIPCTPGGRDFEEYLLCPLTSMPSVFCKKRRLTDSSACRGHSWNQSMAVQFTMAGNFLLRTLSLFPTGDKQRVTWEIRGWGEPRGHQGDTHSETDRALCYFPESREKNPTEEEENLSILARLLAKKLRMLGLHEPRERLLPLKQIRAALQNCSGEEGHSSLPTHSQYNLWGQLVQNNSRGSHEPSLVCLSWAVNLSIPSVVVGPDL